MYCPECEKKSVVGMTKIIDKRTSLSNVTRRRHECTYCGYRFTTYEVIRSRLVVKLKGSTVVKKSANPNRVYKSCLGTTNGVFELV